ncbi:MAG: DUF4392 domain-containing protein, partial [Deltaproteobacteria bacterium]|nr:DUF4392 domain-containing protein [Deltaproteobacteria bacterium]
MGKLYRAALAEAGGRSLTALAAEGIAKRVSRGDVVFLIAGAGYPPLMPKGESDGPPGVAALARILYYGIGAIPVFVSEKIHAEPIMASSEAAGVMIRSFEEAKERRLGGVMLTAPNKQENVKELASEIFDRYRPKAMICAERLGPNEKGIVHGATGLEIGLGTIIDLSPIIGEAERRGVFSVGIGDNGNEFGFGRIYETVREVMPRGKKCQCPCGGGMATVTKTDVLIPASVANWGCYGVEAVLAFLLKNRDLMHTPEEEKRILFACLEAGGLEARYCSKRFIVDGMPGETSMAVVRL